MQPATSALISGVVIGSGLIITAGGVKFGSGINFAFGVISGDTGLHYNKIEAQNIINNLIAKINAITTFNW